MIEIGSGYSTLMAAEAARANAALGGTVTQINAPRVATGRRACG